jgi:hypothetical protein
MDNLFLSGPLVMFIAAAVLALAYLGYRLKAPVIFGVIVVVFLGAAVASVNIMAG